MELDIFFLVVIGTIILFVMCDSGNGDKVENMTSTAATPTSTSTSGSAVSAVSPVSADVREAIRQVYNADVQAIRNLSEVATKLQAGGLTVPGALTVQDNLKLNNPNSTSKSAVFIGDGTWSDNNIYSIRFGDKVNEISHGIGTYGKTRRMFPSSGTSETGGIGVHIRPDSEFTVKSDGWNNLLGVEGGTGNVRARGEIISNMDAGIGQFRAVKGEYGTILRNDGSDTYLLLTNKGQPYGGWNDLRPFYINNVSGNVGMNHNLNVGGKLTVGGRDILAELDDLKNNVVRRDKAYFIRRVDGGILSDHAGLQKAFFQNNLRGWSETMKFEQI